MKATTDRWTRTERAVLSKLRTPYQIQEFLDRTPYRAESTYSSPRSVLADGKAHCFDGALIAAAALRLRGDPPLLVDLRAVRDDDHVITIFKRHGCFGAVAKSNCTGLRFREPIYKSLRELAISYFDDYYNLSGEKTLRSYSDPVDLRRFDKRGWMFRDEALEDVADALDNARHHALMTPAMIRTLSPVDKRSYDAGYLGSNPAGLYQPDSE